jgi:hypothetical protein
MKEMMVWIKNVKPMVFQVLKWLAIAIAIYMMVSGFDTDKYMEENTFFASASFFMLVAIFFHLEQHKS